MTMNLDKATLFASRKPGFKDHHTTPCLTGYTTIRADRDEHSSFKSIEGGLWVFIDNSWATQYCVQEKVCINNLF